MEHCQAAGPFQPRLAASPLCTGPAPRSLPSSSGPCCPAGCPQALTRSKGHHHPAWTSIGDAAARLHCHVLLSTPGTFPEACPRRTHSPGHFGHIQRSVRDTRLNDPAHAPTVCVCARAQKAEWNRGRKMKPGSGRENEQTSTFPPNCVTFSQLSIPSGPNAQHCLVLISKKNGSRDIGNFHRKLQAWISLKCLPTCRKF